MPQNLESTPSSSDSFSVKPAPYTRKSPLKSVTNPDGIGVSFPKKGHGESK